MVGVGLAAHETKLGSVGTVGSSQWISCWAESARQMSPRVQFYFWVAFVVSFDGPLTARLMLSSSCLVVCLVNLNHVTIILERLTVLSVILVDVNAYLGFADCSQAWKSSYVCRKLHNRNMVVDRRVATTFPETAHQDSFSSTAASAWKPTQAFQSRDKPFRSFCFTGYSSRSLCCDYLHIFC